jgi:hypothetical protein
VALAGSTVGAALIVMGGHEAGVAGRGAFAGWRSAGGALAHDCAGVDSDEQEPDEAHGPLAVTAYGILTGTAMLAAG